MAKQTGALAQVSQIPYSWTFNTWPQDVWPGAGSRGRHVVNKHMGELQAAGAITRPTRSIVILGAGYQKWLASKTPRVTEFEIAPNAPKHAGKRFGGKAGKGAV